MISIIVPIYNAEGYLKACIESLIRQTEEDLQLILVNDGSTDESLAIAQSYAAQDARIEIYSQPHAGQSSARNNGLKHAKGEYIAFVDADDALEPDWCERHLAAIDGVDYVQSGYKRCQRSAISNQQSSIKRYLRILTSSPRRVCVSIAVRLSGNCLSPRGTSTKTSFSRRTYG